MTSRFELLVAAVLFLAPAVHADGPAASFVSVALNGAGYSLEVSGSSLAMRFGDGSAVRMVLPRGTPEGVGNPPYEQVTYRSVFPGIDLLLHARGNDLEYDWLVAPAADPLQIRFSFTGARRVSLNSYGDLVIAAPAGEVQHRKPYLYQDIDNVRRRVDGRFTISEDGMVGFQVGAYDKSWPLIIDPQIVYRANLSGPPLYFNEGPLHERFESSVSGTAVDRAGNVYIVGTDLTGPDLVNPVQAQCPRGPCLFVAKLSADGRTILYATFLGSPTRAWGGPGTGYAPYLPSAIACDPDGNVYVTGGTAAANLPQVNGGQGGSAGGNDAFVVKLDPNGALKATMLIGGSADDSGTAITIGRDGFLYVAGTTASMDFPISRTPSVQPISNPPGAFLLKIDPASFIGDNPPTALRYSAIVGNFSAAVAVDSQGNVYLASYDSITKVSSNGTQAAKAAFDAGTGVTTSIAAVAVDAQDNVIVTGTTGAADFPTTSGAWITSPQPAQNLGRKPFLTKLKAEGMEVAYSTYLSNDGSEDILGLALDGSGNAYISGYTYSAQFPVLNSIQSGLTNAFCLAYADEATLQLYCYPTAGFVTAVKPDGSGPLWSSLLPGIGGGIGLDGSGNVYVAGSDASDTGIAPTGVNVLKLSQTGSPIPIDAIVNAASFHPGLPAPGGLATMFVRGLQLTSSLAAPTLSWPTELGGVSITVAGIPAPILSVSSTGAGTQQINFQVPATAPQNSSVAEVDLVYMGVTSVAVPVRVAPGIFTLSDGSGAIQHASDYSLVTPSNPAQKGEVLIVYVTGLGARFSQPAPNPINLGDMLYAGPTPGFPGLSQINFRVSQNVASGASPLTVTWIPNWAFGIDPPPQTPANDSVSNGVMLWIQ